MRVRGRRVAHPACSPFAYSILSVRRSTVARRSLQLRCRNNADAEKGLGSARFRKSTRCPLSRFAGLVRARFWGNGRWAPRSGLVISILLLSALWLSCWLFNKSPPLWPLAVFGLNQYTLRADSLRPHGLGLVWIVLAFAFIWQLTFQAHPKRRTILLAAIAAVLSVQTVFLNAVLLGAVCAASVVVLAVKRSWRRGVLVFGIGLTAAISLLPYVPLIRQAQQWNGIRSTANTPQLIAQWFVQIFTMENPIADVVFVFLVLSVLALAIIPALRKRAANTEEGVGGHFLCEIGRAHV